MIIDGEIKVFSGRRFELSVTASLYAEAAEGERTEVLVHECEAYGRGFSTIEGLSTHQSLHCGFIHRMSEGSYEVEAILDAGGTPQHRFYYVK